VSRDDPFRSILPEPSTPTALFGVAALTNDPNGQPGGNPAGGSPASRWSGVHSFFYVSSAT